MTEWPAETPTAIILCTLLEMALENYIKPELLNGDNQYFCEKCNKEDIFIMKTKTYAKEQIRFAVI